jgi:hypothetical protein
MNICVLIFHTTLCETFLMLRRIKQNIIIDAHRCSREVHVILVRFYSTWILSMGLQKYPQILNFMNIRPVGAELFHADDEANSHSAAILRTGLKIRHPFSFN